MQILHFDYDMKITFDRTVSNHRFTVRCVPKSSERQTVRSLHYSIYPDATLSTGFSHGTDSFGNFCVYGECPLAHDHFQIHVEGDVQTGLREYETGEAEHMLGRYRYDTFYTKPGENILSYFRGFHFKQTDSAFDKGLVMMHKLYQDLSYTPGATDIRTTAEEALSLGKGVCQDYSHILIALCHLEHIPTRYVVGMLVGEGASHAWVEIYDRGKWFALDPTNNVFVDDQHIKISHGRDYRDCLINQGIFTGNARQTQAIDVRVEPV